MAIILHLRNIERNAYNSPVMSRLLPTIGLALLLWLWSAATYAQPPLEVKVEGITGPALENVKILLSIEQQRSHPDLTEGRIRRLHRKASQEIRRALEPFGYYRPEIQAELQMTDSGWLASYRIEPGPPMRIDVADISITGPGAEEQAFQVLLKDHPLNPGGILEHAAYEEFKRDVQQLAERLGYFDANFTFHEIRVDLAAYTATVTLHYATGARYQFGPVEFRGEVPLKTDLLQRFVTFDPGEPFDAAALVNLQNALNNSDYFEHIDVRIAREAAVDQTMPIIVHLTMRKRIRYLFGLGYGTDTGVRGSIGMERRYVNRHGHRFAAEAKASQIRGSVEARYIIPLLQPRTDRLVLRSEYSRERIEDTDSEVVLLESVFEHAAGPWRRSYALTYQLEEFTVGTQSGKSRLLMPSVIWSRTSSEGGMHTIRGSRIDVELRGASDAIASDSTFLQGRLYGKYIRRLNSGRFIVRGEVGSSWVPEFKELPPSVRFFAGGDYSVRGYAYKSLGPEDSEGNVIGGKHLLAGSLEYEHEFTEKWSGALFYDVGNAFNRFDETDLERGAGLGLRRKLPFGWLRLDIAQATTRTDRPWRLHLTLGPDL